MDGDMTQNENIENLKLLFENMVEGVAIHKMIYDENKNPIDYRIIDINKSYEKYTGINKEKAIGTTAKDLYGTKEAPYIKEYNGVILTKTPLIFETYFEPMKKWFSITVISSKDDQFTTIFQDITARKTIDDKLKESEKKYSDLIEGARDMVAIIQDEKIKFANKATTTFGGYSPEEVLNDNFLNFIAPESKANVLAHYMARKMGDSKPQIYEMNMIRKDGAKIPIEIASTLIQYEGKNASLAFMRDITDRKAEENELRKQKEELEKANKFMVDREVKMVELKNEVEKLKAELAKK